MSALDLAAMRARALALRNMIPGHDDGEDPYVLHVYEIEDADGCRPIEHDSHECDYFPLESRVYVADHCLMATVPTNEGALMPDVAEAIALAGADQLALIARVKELEVENKHANDVRVQLKLERDALFEQVAGLREAGDRLAKAEVLKDVLATLEQEGRRHSEDRRLMDSTRSYHKGAMEAYGDARDRLISAIGGA